ncbi:hypothetical protein IAG25_33155 [Caballeronia sp. EK]|uniref:hypothetical protein n=1 Tax=Caballeronia sp. EK TaxID=2767469 RepID=UPI001655906C|nr:hypothetical protein [Caballeronia sp. EK]MBC8641676.1 hypothetical protein [Caballeronia sp. EK]
MREYALFDKDTTTGWDAQAFQINARNSFGMRPIEVAAQAANVEEFNAIRNHPDFDPAGAGPHFFADVGRTTRDGYANSEALYKPIAAALRSYNAQFPYDEALKTRVKAAEQAGLPAVSPDDSTAVRAAKERFFAATAVNSDSADADAPASAPRTRF